ncbi:hypothetical protein LAZ67_9002158 [Cordylochernes scorpioides]|uniref:RNase H type-1 domain-containing protein n=1 Tax=Cordylochernes scorpioides TaxID=51811 RepID=A0ABY6KTM9_9ARAC|nr:hypothetical protein LAZ67_9002158 [Cordylochernes scorpioides]
MLSIHLVVNTLKTETSLFTTNRRLQNYKPNIYFNDNLLPPQCYTTHKRYSAKHKTITKIIKILKKISQENQITFQWIPSHVNIDGNEMADQLTKEGCKGQPENSQLTYSEISFIHKQRITSLWKFTLNHFWYNPIPNKSSFHTLTREEQTAISRL